MVKAKVKIVKWRDRKPSVPAEFGESTEFGELRRKNEPPRACGPSPLPRRSFSRKL
jgi:hypothetical protein